MPDEPYRHIQKDLFGICGLFVKRLNLNLDVSLLVQQNQLEKRKKDRKENNNKPD